MHNILRASIVYRALAAAGAWFGAQWRSSVIVNRFLSLGVVKRMSEGSVFERIWQSFHRGLCAVFRKLRLDRLLSGSIFAKPYIWSFLALILAPILPTMAVLAISLICITTLILAFGCDKERRLVYSPVNKYILLFAFIYIVATLTSVTLSGSLLGGALTTLFVLFTIVMQNSVTTRRQYDALVYAFVISGAVVAAYGIYQYVFGASGASAWLDSTMFAGSGVRVYSTLGNPNVLSEYLLLVIPFAGACLIIAKGVIPKLFFAGCLGAMLLCMVLTFARGGWLGLIIAAAIFLVMLDRRLILVGVAMLIILYFTLPDYILKRFFSIGNIGDSSTSYRVSIWQATLVMLRDHWFTGIGPGTAAFNRIYPLYSFNTVSAPHSHNLFLQITVETGISGIIFFVLILFNYIRNLCSANAAKLPAAIPAPASAKSSKILQIASITSVLGFLVQSATDHSFYNYRVTLVFWAVLGLGAIAARRDELAGS